MKKKAVRIVLLVAVLGGLAAIPASTQGLLPSSAASSDDAGVDLQMVLLVNRLELTGQQMGTLHSAIVELVGKAHALDQKRAAFEEEMIAFSGTSAELDARLAAFQEEMTASQAAFEQELSSAVSTLKTTLSMKQGEILAAVFPGIAGFPTAASSTPPAGRLGLVTKSERAMMRNGRQALIFRPSGVDSPDAIPGRPRVARRFQALVERLAERFAGTAAEVAIAARVCPMMETMKSQTGSAATGQGVTSAGDIKDTGSLGSVGLSLSDSGSVGGTPVRAQRLANWLERFARVLELKLAAMK